MLGKNHTLVGVTGWLITLPLLLALQIPGFEITTLTQVLMSIIVVAGASVIPDFDEPNATPAQTFGRIGKFVSRRMKTLAGGHRQRTHSLLFPFIAGGITYGLTFFYTDTTDAIGFITRVPAALIVLFNAIVGAILMSRGMRKWGVKYKVGVAWWLGLASAFILIIGSDAIGQTLEEVQGLSPEKWLPYTIGFGCLWHLVGDFPTKAGLPLLLPFSTRKFKMPIFNFRVGGSAERRIGIFLGFVLILTIIWIIATKQLNDNIISFI